MSINRQNKKRIVWVVCTLLFACLLKLAYWFVPEASCYDAIQHKRSLGVCTFSALYIDKSLGPLAGFAYDGHVNGVDTTDDELYLWYYFWTRDNQQTKDSYWLRQFLNAATCSPPLKKGMRYSYGERSYRAIRVAAQRGDIDALIFLKHNDPCKISPQAPPTASGQTT